MRQKEFVITKLNHIKNVFYKEISIFVSVFVLNKCINDIVL